MSVDFKKNGVATAASFGSTAAPLQEMEIKSLDDGSVWARIHYLDVSRLEEYFADEAEVMKCIDKTNRYSRMGIVDMFRQSDGTFEFMITYPLTSALYNRWSQTMSPLTETDILNASDTGFKAITSAWPNQFGPIRKFPSSHGNYKNTIFRCANLAVNSWWAPIGQKRRYDVADATGNIYYIPAASAVSNKATELWVRIDQLPETSICQIFDNSITATSFIEI